MARGGDDGDREPDPDVGCAGIALVEQASAGVRLWRPPVLSPHLAAVAGTCGELFFPTLLVVGVMSRVAALGLSAVNVMAVISYSQVLLAEGSEAALAQHVLWGSILAFLSIYGPGAWSLDRWLKRSPV